MKQSKPSKSDHSERKHSSVGASGAHRWLNCPGSVAAEAASPQQEDSKAARSGTDKHESMEKYLGHLIAGKRAVFSPGDRDLIPVYNYVAERIKELDVEAEEALLLEEKVDLAFIDPDCYGTNDIAIVQMFGWLDVIDLKTGSVPVSPIENLQLIFYAIGIAEKYDWAFSDVRLSIGQTTADEVMSHWDISIEKLQSYVPLFKKGVERTKKKDAPRFADPKWCHYCRAAATCPELTNRSLAKAQIDFDIDEPKALVPVAKSLSPAKLSEYLEVAAKLEIWIKAVRKTAQEVLSAKKVVPGWQLIQTKGKRVWKSEKGAAAAAKKMKLDFYSQEPLSPAELEKLVGKDKFEERFSVFVTKKSSGNEVLTRVRDVTNDFEEVESEW